MKYYSYLLLIIFLVQAKFSLAEVKLPTFFSNNMVIQRNVEFNVWGYADAAEKVYVEFNNENRTTIADENGYWNVQFSPMKTQDTPLKMIIMGKNLITLTNILIGDVWFCSGQSNMQMPLEGWPSQPVIDSEKEINNANNYKIRLLNVSQELAFTEYDTVETTNWQIMDSKSAAKFSAVGYFFGQYIQEQTNVPIGLICSAWSGTNIEAFMSSEAIANFPDDKKKLQSIEPYKGKNFKYVEDSVKKKTEEWIQRYYPRIDKGMKEKWFAKDFNDKSWDTITIPQKIENKVPDFDGIIWLRKKVIIPEKFNEKEKLFIKLGKLYDFDIVWFNGEKIGENFDKSQWRTYKIPKNLIKFGEENTITIRIFNAKGEGGLIEPMQSLMTINSDKWTNNKEEEVPIYGVWNYKISDKFDASKLKFEYNPLVLHRNIYPTLLYNAMIAPFTNYKIKGVIWYQGEANAKNKISEKYRELFPAMIKDWRTQWGYDFPFLFVQLAAFKEAPKQPQESNWAKVREAQLLSLAVKNTGMAVAIDIGHPTNIHPPDKKTVGIRLGLAAMKVAYNKNIVHSGPIYKSMKVEGDTIRLFFENTADGLTTPDKYGYLKTFAIAGADKKFYWAKAEIAGNSVIVYRQDIKSPVAVRYAWANNPEGANLYNSENLPASPFRTDKW